MSNETSLVEMIEGAEHQRSARRNFIRMCGGAAMMTGGLSLLAACDNDENDVTPAPAPSPTPTPTSATVTDVDVLNFALQLEYL